MRTTLSYILMAMILLILVLPVKLTSNVQSQDVSNASVHYLIGINDGKTGLKDETMKDSVSSEQSDLDENNADLESWMYDLSQWNIDR